MKPWKRLKSIAAVKLVREVIALLALVYPEALAGDGIFPGPTSQMTRCHDFLPQQHHPASWVTRQQPARVPENSACQLTGLLSHQLAYLPYTSEVPTSDEENFRKGRSDVCRTATESGNRFTKTTVYIFIGAEALTRVGEHLCSPGSCIKDGKDSETSHRVRSAQDASVARRIKLAIQQSPYDNSFEWKGLSQIFPD